VAVNPFLGFADRPFAATCAMMHRVARVDMLMHRSFYREALRTGTIGDEDLAAALAAAPRNWQRPSSVAELKAELARDVATKSKHIAHVASVAEVLDSLAGGDRNASRTAFMTDEISKWCAAYFDDGQSAWRLPSRGLRPYPAWRASMRYDRNAEVMGIARFRALVDELPEKPSAAIAAVVERIGVPARAIEEYLYQALLDISGWAAYAGYLVWQSELAGLPDDTLVQLLAIRIVWGYTLFEQRTDEAFSAAWREAMAEAAAVPQDERLGEDRDLCVDLIVHDAYERSYQRRLIGAFRRRSASMCDPRCIAARSRVWLQKRRRLVLPGFSVIRSSTSRSAISAATRSVPCSSRRCSRSARRSSTPPMRRTRTFSDCGVCAAGSPKRGNRSRSRPSRRSCSSRPRGCSSPAKFSPTASV
jgi:hypothetical protein